MNKSIMTAKYDHPSCILNRANLLDRAEPIPTQLQQNAKHVRRWRNLKIVLFMAFFVVMIEAIYAIQLYQTAFFSGWLLLILVASLVAYNLRKKLPAVLLGSSSTWLQIHIYSALLSFVVFVMHVGFRIPNGVFETVLSTMYCGAFFSGLVGLILTRTIPPRLTSRGQEVLFERIPMFIRKLRMEVESLVYDTISDTRTTAVPEIYLEYLQPFFERPRNILWHLLNSARPRQLLLLQIDSQRRFLNEDEQHVIQEISERVEIKDDLDYQFAMQGILKCWLFVHVPLSYGLLILTLFHLVVVYSFAGGS